MNKRGQGETQQLFMLMEVVIGILVAGIFIFSAANPDPYTNVNKLYAQQDISLLVDTIGSAPGVVNYDYSISSNYQVTIDEEKVSIVRVENSLLGGSDKKNITLSKNVIT